MIHHLNIDANIRWIGPVEPWEAIAHYLRLAEIMITVASSDSTPVSLLEAMACGIPIIASNLPSIREWIVDGENGLLIPPRDPTLLAQAIVNLLDDPQSCQRFSAKNIELIRNRADHEIEMQKMESLYHQLLPSHPLKQP
jgi:glycosyltransferase involved in cell wall biosynthesis